LSSLTLVVIILPLLHSWGEVGGDLEIAFRALPKIIAGIWSISIVSVIFDDFHSRANFLSAIYLGLLIPYTNDEPAWAVLANRASRMVAACFS